MRRLLLLALFAACAATPALAAARPLDLSPQYPIEHVQAAADRPSQPYAMNYTDEAAQALGVSGGKWEAFDTGSSDSLLPSLKGGVDNGSAMIKLQWRPGE